MRFERLKLRYPASTGPGLPLNIEDFPTLKTLQVLGGVGFDFTVEASLDGVNWFEVVSSITSPVASVDFSVLARFLRVNVTTVGTAPAINVYRSTSIVTAIPFSSTISTDFDGSNDFVDLGNDSSLRILNNLTVSFWMKGPVATLGMMSAKWQPTGDQRSWAMATITGGKLRVFLSANGASSGKDYSSSVVVSDNTWHHAAFTFATNVLKIYINGTEDTSVTKTTDLTVNALHNSTDPVLIGRQAAGNSYQGRIDEWSIWNVALSDAEIAEIYNSGKPANLSLHSQQASNVSWLRMGDNDTFPIIADNKGSNDGTMTNMDAGDFVEDAP